MRVMFAYWGRRGSMPQFTLEVGRAAVANPKIEATISVSRQSAHISQYEAFGSALFPIDTFGSTSGALLQAHRIPILRNRLLERLKRDRIQAVIELMPHVWSPFVMSVAAKAGARYCTIVHDADTHPGDYRSAVAKSLLDRSMMSADLVFTLSSAVAGRLSAMGSVPSKRVHTLFHPDLNYGTSLRKTPPAVNEPLRLLFLGRIMPYKGLGLFLDTVDLLTEAGIAVEVGVFGEGALGASAERLRRMGAEVVNRWLRPEDFLDALSRYHAVVLSHIEASQSGVAAAAFGAGVPVVATPVGGLVEQVIDGVTGMLALRADAPALADAVKQLLCDPLIFRTTCDNLVRSADQRSMQRFVSDVATQAVFTQLSSAARSTTHPAKPMFCH